MWNARSISKIASAIGCLIATDRLTANRQRLAYARVLVEVKLTSPLLDKINIQDPKGKQYTQKVNYELKPKWCDVCKQVGHDLKTCRRLVKTQRWVPKQNQNPITGNIGKEKANTVNVILITHEHEKDLQENVSNANLNMDNAEHEGSKQAEHSQRTVYISDTGMKTITIR
ncbi:uncharacterized protein LOC109831367 [Asparagus officinalis]|uniref:uncharacterized protein LOC109831367 n=1 Tax=Asparagus officinalis TaxID=4686 RepID=UPI00098E569E|nr:uncharacterized protein LOC109831367 [Asparagus officinalis]